MKRRAFIKSSVAVGAGLLLPSPFWGEEKAQIMTALKGRVMTVLGPIPPAKLGFTLTHEHVLVDFIGADRVSPDRYDADEVFEVVLPYLKQAKELGCESFVECTPAYLGRDVRLLKRLSEATGIQILTNTGYYGAANDKYVPAHAYEETADQLADRWVKEWEAGIGDTGIRPGFIKIGVDRTSLSEIDRKLVRAAARTHLRTGLTILAHTGYDRPAHEELAVLKEEGVDGSAWVWTHAQNEKDNGSHVRAAKAGAWIAFDGISSGKMDLILNHVKAMKAAGVLDQVLLSHDAGWYRPGESGGGKFRPYDLMFTEFLPALKGNGFSDEEIHLLTVENPKRAFAVQVRARS